MRIAIPTFGERVSPRFDCAQTLLLIEVDDSQPVDKRELVAATWAPHERINKLVELGVDTVICGGIDCWSAESLQSVGINTYGWVTGTAEDALARLLRGELAPSAAMPPGPDQPAVGSAADAAAAEDLAADVAVDLAVDVDAGDDAFASRVYRKVTGRK